MSELTIGTWNVQYARGLEKNRRRREVLTSHAAQVWVLTETHDDLDLSATHQAVHSGPRYAQAGGRWTTIWTSFPVLEHLEVADPHRCVAVRLDAAEAGEVVVYGTVLPWNGDAGPDASNPARGWDEFKRVVPAQGREWAALRQQFPHATLVVAGDLNQDLGGRHYYGSKKCRALLRAALAEARIACLTTTDRFSGDVLQHPPIDHVCVGAGEGRGFSTEVDGWNKNVDGVPLSDHSGVLVKLVGRPRAGTAASHDAAGQR